ncbi:DNA polymerase III, beta subunit [Hoeflea phototrophica DFL-43]|uniref:Beta sliding clamp n=1 Tax=Hoeflea phototrophica (strain DSM 17068 / NCIMB 14078 / DFL-43) TaxID=411684 RepID=A9D4N4_HOEPD|nr:DNA polymerase III subunit beta [Hoeflea phototrophica]EDQ33917.1 DNA polymerase III, beta subunit [Hoeflea phototrophica DFL-43]
MTTPFSLTAPRAALLAAVETALGAVERRNTIPVLANLLLESTADDGLRVSGTDLDVMTTVATGLDAEPRQYAGVTLPAHLLHDILRKLPDKAEVSLKTDGSGQMTLTSGRSRFNLQTLPGADWPRLQEKTAPAATFEIPAAKFAAQLAAVGFAISTEETRYYLNGVYMHAIDNRLVTVATDGHRLARAVYSAAVGVMPAADAMPGIIIPRKTVGLVAKALAAAAKDATLAIAVSENMISFELGATRIASKLIDGTFPDYERVIPIANPNSWRFDVAALLQATERVSIISSERGRAVKMAWGRESIDLTVINPDAGEGQDQVSVDADTGEEVEIGFNAKYLADMLGHMSKSGSVHLNTGGDPARFEPVHADDDEIAMTFVLMPMRV